MEKSNIEYRQSYDDPWIYYAIVGNSKERIYIYRDDKAENDSRYNKWELAADKSVDFDRWWRLEEYWDRDTTVTEVNDDYLKEHSIPHLEVDEDGAVVN